MGDRKSQRKIVIEYLRKNRKGLTSMKAFWRWRITRLSAIIYDLREKGFVINTIMEDNVFVCGKHARYVLMFERNQNDRVC